MARRQHIYNVTYRLKINLVASPTSLSDWREAHSLGELSSTVDRVGDYRSAATADLDEPC